MHARPAVLTVLIHLVASEHPPRDLCVALRHTLRNSAAADRGCDRVEGGGRVSDRVEGSGQQLQTEGVTA
jgi:hypothetical protein